MTDNADREKESDKWITFSKQNLALISLLIGILVLFATALQYVAQAR